MEYQTRKHPRLKDYDYSLPGYYFVTIHMKQNAPALSSVKQERASAGTQVQLTEYGEIAEQQLLALESRYGNVKIDKHIIMPTHIHAIIHLTEAAAGDGERPNLMDMIGAYKSLATRAWNRTFHTPGRKLFQTSFYESVLRSEKAYQECWRYIDENPAKWMLNPEDI